MFAIWPQNEYEIPEANKAKKLAHVSIKTPFHAPPNPAT